MKKRLIGFWYVMYIIVLLTFDIHPRVFVVGALFSMIVIPFSIVNIFFTAIQVIKFRFQRQGVIAITIFLLSAFQILRLISIHSVDKQGDIKILSYNASFFRIPSLYSHEYFNPRTPTVNDKMLDWIIAQDADILCFQEFFNDEKSPNFNNIKAIKARGGYTDHYYINAPRHDNGTSRGLIVFTRSPIISGRKLFLGENRFNGAEEIYTTWKGDTVRIVNVHLKSSEFELRKNIKSPGGMWNEMKKFFNDGKLKAYQTDLILDSIGNSQVPTIICGDFNSTRFSYVYDEMTDHFDNLYRAKGNGFGFTLRGWFGLPLKLDHQFFGEGVVPRSIEIVDSVKYSDHFPLIATYDLQK